jgi:transposase InsO family protein
MLHWIYKTQKEANFKIQTIRLDNSGENTALKKLIDGTENQKIKFEFTAPGTPEQNGKIERTFATLYGKTRFLLYSAKLTFLLSKGLWA